MVPNYTQPREVLSRKPAPDLHLKPVCGSLPTLRASRGGPQGSLPRRAGHTSAAEAGKAPWQAAPSPEGFEGTPGTAPFACPVQGSSRSAWPAGPAPCPRGVPAFHARELTCLPAAVKTTPCVKMQTDCKLSTPVDNRVHNLSRSGMTGHGGTRWHGGSRRSSSSQARGTCPRSIRPWQPMWTRTHIPGWIEEDPEGSNPPERFGARHVLHLSTPCIGAMWICGPVCERIGGVLGESTGPQRSRARHELGEHQLGQAVEDDGCE